MEQIEKLKVPNDYKMDASFFYKINELVDTVNKQSFDIAMLTDWVDGKVMEAGSKIKGSITISKDIEADDYDMLRVTLVNWLYHFGIIQIGDNPETINPLLDYLMIDIKNKFDIKVK